MSLIHCHLRYTSLFDLCIVVRNDMVSIHPPGSNEYVVRYRVTDKGWVLNDSNYFGVNWPQWICTGAQLVDLFRRVRTEIHKEHSSLHYDVLVGAEKYEC